MVYVSNAKYVVQSEVTLHKEGNFIFLQPETDTRMGFYSMETSSRFFSVGPLSRGCGISHILCICDTPTVSSGHSKAALWRHLEDHCWKSPSLSSVCSLGQWRNTTLTSIWIGCICPLEPNMSDHSWGAMTQLAQVQCSNNSNFTKFYPVAEVSGRQMTAWLSGVTHWHS